MGIYSLVLFMLLTLLLCSLLLSSNIFCFTDHCPELFSSYECGFEPIGSSHLPFCIKFFVIAIIFIVFDVEISFIVPCLYSSLVMFSMIVVLLLGLLFEFAYGGLS